MTKREMKSLYNRAAWAGKQAGERIKPTPMVVYEADGLSNRPRPGAQVWTVNEGVCGFAWVNIKATTGFARWLKAEGIGHKSYYGGWDIWVWEFGQSMTRKAAYAAAFAKVLNDAGIVAHAQSRMD